MTLIVSLVLPGFGGAVWPTRYTSETPNRATRATSGTATPNSRTMPCDTSSRSPTNGSPGRSRRHHAITSIATAPRNTTVAAASIHHHSSAMSCAGLLCVLRIDCFPHPPTPRSDRRRNQ